MDLVSCYFGLFKKLKIQLKGAVLKSSKKFKPNHKLCRTLSYEYGKNIVTSAFYK